MIIDAPDFQKVHQPIITLTRGTRHSAIFSFYSGNIIEGSIYLAVRLCIEPNWLNDRDQFLFPTKDGYNRDTTFRNNCLLFTLFNGQNRITSKEGENHWIPFTAEEVDAKDNFKSSFISDYIKDKKLNKEAKAVLNSGKELWKYYHSKNKEPPHRTQ